MPSAARLSEKEKGQIEALRRLGQSFRSIAREIGRSDHVVRSFLANPTGYGSKNLGGRPKLLSRRDERRIVNAASNSTKSCSDIKRECNLDVSLSTIWRTLNKNPNIVRSKMQVAPRLKDVHKLARLEFARSNMSTDWKMVCI